MERKFEVGDWVEINVGDKKEKGIIRLTHGIRAWVEINAGFTGLYERNYENITLLHTPEKVLIEVNPNPVLDISTQRGVSEISKGIKSSLRTMGTTASLMNQVIKVVFEAQYERNIHLPDIVIGFKKVQDANAFSETLANRLNDMFNIGMVNRDTFLLGFRIVCVDLNNVEQTKQRLLGSNLVVLFIDHEVAEYLYKGIAQDIFSLSKSHIRIVDSIRYIRERIGTRSTGV